MSKKKQRPSTRTPDARVAFVGPVSPVKCAAVSAISDIRTTTRRASVPAGAGERLRRRLEHEGAGLVYGEWRTGPAGRVGVYAVPGEDVFSGTSAAPAACTPVVLWIDADAEHAEGVAREWLALLAPVGAPVTVAVVGSGAAQLVDRLALVTPVSARAVQVDRDGVGRAILTALGHVAAAQAASAA